jgi:hypothetical protein
MMRIPRESLGAQRAQWSKILAPATAIVRTDGVLGPQEPPLRPLGTGEPTGLHSR